MAVEICANCYVERPLFARAVSYAGYTGELRELIHLLKYHQVRPASGVLGRMLAQAAEPLLAGFESQTIFVIPVPLHAGKFRERGFNQSELIARSAIRELGRQAARRSATKLEIVDHRSAAPPRDRIAGWHDARRAAGKHPRRFCRRRQRADRRA